ncbi:STAS domain-containing protein [Streptomyces sp. NPDC055085]
MPAVSAGSAPGATGSSRLVIDFCEVTVMHSSTVSALALALGEVQGLGGWIRLAALSPAMRDTVRAVGLDMIIPCYPTLTQALTGEAEAPSFR